MKPEMLLDLISILPPSMKLRAFKDLLNECRELDVEDNIPLLTEVAA